MKRTKGYLALATGRVFQGWAFGATGGDVSGEVVFNTSLTGYQEILTDPSYHGQIVAMTPSHIGNTGINREDVESKRIFLSGFVVQELSGLVSNWRASTDLNDYFASAGIAGLTGVDTRALTRHLREIGAVTGLITTSDDREAAIQRARALPGLEGRNLVADVTTEKAFQWTEGSGDWASWSPGESKAKRKVVVVDFGVKRNILRCLVDLGCEVDVVPASTPASEILNYKPDGVLLSNGPGDPAAVGEGVRVIKELVEYDEKRAERGEKPVAVFGICLGHQLLGLALGGTTYKLKFGHHGGNHPIKEFETGRVDITSQNHGFCLAGESAKDGSWRLTGNDEVDVTHINLNDNAIEGLRHKRLPLFSVQYHPEASAGPHDARHLFERFLKSMDETPAEKK